MVIEREKERGKEREREREREKKTDRKHLACSFRLYRDFILTTPPLTLVVDCAKVACWRDDAKPVKPIGRPRDRPSPIHDT